MSGNASEKRTPAFGGVRPVLIFCAFSGGAVLSHLAGEEAAFLDLLEPSVSLYALAFGAVLMLSASILGIALLPIGAFVFGGIFGRYADVLVTAFLAEGILDLRGLLLGVTVIPAFFVLTVRGMYTSEMLGSMLDRASASARAEYNREYIPMTAAALAVLAAGCFIDHMRL